MGSAAEGAAAVLGCRCSVRGGRHSREGQHCTVRCCAPVGSTADRYRMALPSDGACDHMPGEAPHYEEDRCPPRTARRTLAQAAAVPAGQPAPHLNITCRSGSHMRTNTGSSSGRRSNTGSRETATCTEWRLSGDAVHYPGAPDWTTACTMHREAVGGADGVALSAQRRI